MTDLGSTPKRLSKRRSIMFDLLFLLVLIGAAFLRFRGSDWGQLQHQHPDEGFLTSVTYDIGLIGAEIDNYPLPSSQIAPWRTNYIETFQDCIQWGDYFDTSCSPLNPNNRGHSFFTYGTLPLFMTRYLAEWTDQMGSLKLFGRQLSAVMDLLTILVLYLIGCRYYGKFTALLGAAFSSLAVMQIQQSHFYTSDLFSNFFIYLAIFITVEISFGKRVDLDPAPVETSKPGANSWKKWLKDKDLVLSAVFGIVYGMAMASKLTAAPVALLLPLAFVIKYFKQDDKKSNQDLINRIFFFLVVGGVFAILSFRVFQPYAFDGLGLNPQWLSNILEQRAQASPNADLPWNLQWADRSVFFSLKNLTIWGLGLPLGILAWAGFLFMGWRIFKGEWRRHLLLWAWTAGYFIWQSLQYNPTMRYQLPVYPLLALMASWLLVTLWQKKDSRKVQKKQGRKLVLVRRISSLVLGLLVLAATTVWAVGFSGIYSREEPRMAASNWIFENIPGPITLQIHTDQGGDIQQPLPVMMGNTAIQPDLPLDSLFVARYAGSLQTILLPHILDTSSSGVQELTISITRDPTLDPDQELQTFGTIVSDFSTGDPSQGGTYSMELDQPIVLVKDHVYYLHIETSGGSIKLGGSAVVNETDYDYGLPFRVSGYDGFGGLYRGDLNLQVYWDDNLDKLSRFITTLNAADYIFIPTNHQYGQITRLPERYPLTTAYYRALIGCPDDHEIIWCYQNAEPGTFQGDLGFNLVAVFKSYPQLWGFSINDQGAEEAFTFYDHPKVMIFQKSSQYDPGKVESFLSSIDLDGVVRLTPGQADDYKSLLLSADSLNEQQAGGTWSELFNTQSLLNRYPLIGLLIWYLLIFLLGLVVYPIVRLAFPGLKDKGYPLSRTIGLLLWAWLSWMAGSIGLSYDRPVIGLLLLLLISLGGALAYRQRRELASEWKEKWKYFLMIEAIFLVFFLLDLMIRLGNPDLWHPYKGGERPMDFSYFNAVLKSSSFPPYDPWFAGGYINYYYFGYVIVGTPVKFLGIVPAYAYNFILPTLYSLLAFNAFSVGWNLLSGKNDDQDNSWKGLKQRPALLAGVVSASVMVLLGNLGILRMLYQGFQRIVAPGGDISGANIVQRLWWAVQGFAKTLTGAALPYVTGDWYWLPSRVIPAAGDVEPITEFPLFTFLYSDLHAHMIALPLTVVAIAWVVSVLISHSKWTSWVGAVAGMGLGALIIGSLKPTNTWDYYTYLVLGILALAYGILRSPIIKNRSLKLHPLINKLILTIGAVTCLFVLSLFLFQPFSHWFSQAYGSVDYWKYSHTSISSYLTQWGVFLFLIVTWLTWETRQWLAETPLSSLGKLKPYRFAIAAAFFLLVAVVIGLLISGVSIAWLVLPLASWAAILIFRKEMPDKKRLVLFMVGTALVLTLVVELVVLRGDIGRMNTVFKFYLQAWVLLGIAAAVSAGWLVTEILKWKPNWRAGWIILGSILLVSSSLFLLLGGIDKIRDRWVPAAPHTLDSMAYMQFATYADFGVDMDLSQDYSAIRWMQENVQGSPVIVEANVPEYRWGTRFTIYTGLPGVVGWNWHQRQQRVFSSIQVYDRVEEVNAFYLTSDPQEAANFLAKYNVRYIIVGQLEWAEYRDPIGNDAGLRKFEQFNDVLWKEVYRQADTVIYQVIENE
ncbi:DUF2298 domain-containing protein [Chloroflexota bacterium]